MTNKACVRVLSVVSSREGSRLSSEFERMDIAALLDEDGIFVDRGDFAQFRQFSSVKFR